MLRNVLHRSKRYEVDPEAEARIAERLANLFPGHAEADAGQNGDEENGSVPGAAEAVDAGTAPVERSTSRRSSRPIRYDDLIGKTPRDDADLIGVMTADDTPLIGVMAEPWERRPDREDEVVASAVVNAPAGAASAPEAALAPSEVEIVATRARHSAAHSPRTARPGVAPGAEAGKAARRASGRRPAGEPHSGAEPHPGSAPHPGGAPHPSERPASGRGRPRNMPVEKPVASVDPTAAVDAVNTKTRAGTKPAVAVRPLEPRAVAVPVEPPTAATKPAASTKLTAAVKAAAAKAAAAMTADGTPAETTVIVKRAAAAAKATASAKRSATVRPGAGGAAGSRKLARHAGDRRSPKTAAKRAPSAPVAAAFCPYCGTLLQPPPKTSRRCSQCRQRIIVKRIDDRLVYLAEAALPVFEAERRRVAGSGKLIRQRDRWLALAGEAGASAQRTARVAAALPSEEAIEAARALYMSTVERAHRMARRDRQWESAALIRRKQAAVLYRLAGSPLPPPDEVVALHREAVMAELRGVGEFSLSAQLLGSNCCDACRQDDRQVFRVAKELRATRLPHQGCPRGLCRCGWSIPPRDLRALNRFLRRRPRVESPRSATQLEPGTSPTARSESSPA